MTINAKFASKCPKCVQFINVGDRVNWAPGQKASHVVCPSNVPNAITDVAAWMQSQETQTVASVQDATPEILRDIKLRLPVWMMKDRGLMGRVIVGKVLRETARAWEFEGHASAEPADTCHRCGKDITHPKSLNIGYGPTCCKHLGIEWNKVVTEEDYEALRQRIATENTIKTWLPKSVVQEITVGA